LTELAVLADRCAALGARYLRIMSYPNDGLSEADWECEVLRRIELLARGAERHGVVLLHENCSGWAGRDADRALRLLDAAGSDAFGLLFDTGNGAAHGYRPLDLLRPLAPYVRHVQVKDAVRRADGEVVYRTPGEGDAEVGACLRLLLESGYRGHWSIEPHIAVRPHEGHRDEPAACRAAFTRCGQALRELAETAAAEAGGSWQGSAAGLEWTPPC
jgi:sugar phosphate isomerase/epimerase